MQAVEEQKVKQKQRGRTPRAFRFTERDKEILTFINEFGFCEMPQLNKRFKLNHPRNYQIMKRLIENGLVIHQPVLHGEHGTYRLSKYGALSTDTNLPPLASVPLAIYHHELKVIEVYLRLRLEYPDARWISARHLMQEKHKNGVGKKGHLPDGVLVLESGEQIAIEVELTVKGSHRLERILKGYGGAFEYKTVRYYCSKKTKAKITSMTAQMPFISVYSLEELLKEEKEELLNEFLAS